MPDRERKKHKNWCSKHQAVHQERHYATCRYPNDKKVAMPDKKECPHGVRPPKYCDFCSVELKRRCRCDYSKSSRITLSKDGICPKCGGKFMPDRVGEILKSLKEYGWEHGASGITIAQARYELLKVVLECVPEPSKRRIVENMRTADLMENVGHNNCRKAVIEAMEKLFK